MTMRKFASVKDFVHAPTDDPQARREMYCLWLMTRGLSDEIIRAMGAAQQQCDLTTIRAYLDAKPSIAAERPDSFPPIAPISAAIS